MKLAAISTFVTAGFALFMDMASAQPCPQLRVHVKAPRMVRSDNKLRNVMITVKNAGNTAANNIGLDMTLPDHVLYVTQSKSKTSATFAANGQDLTWSGINLAKKGSSLRVRLKLNTTSCVDGQLAFAAAASVPDCPATASNNALASVKHRYGWTACPPPAPTELCYEPSYGAYECPNEVNVCGQGVDLPPGTANNMQECVQACLNDAVEAGYTYAKWIQLAFGQCVCYTTATGFSTNNIVASFALGQPRTPPNNGCA